MAFRVAHDPQLQSLKDFAKRAPGEIVRADDTAPLKIAAYEAIWMTAAVVI